MKRKMNKEYDIDGELKEVGVFNFVKNNPTYNFDYIAHAYYQLFTHLLKYLADKNTSDKIDIEFFCDGKCNIAKIRKGDSTSTKSVYYDTVENGKIHISSTEDPATEMTLSTIHFNDHSIQFLLQCTTDAINFHIPHFDVDKLVRYTMKIFDTLGLSQYFKGFPESSTLEDQVLKFFRFNESTLKLLASHYQTLVALTFPTPTINRSLTFDANHVHFDWDTLLIESSKQKYLPLTVKTIRHFHYTFLAGNDKVSDVLVLENDTLHHYLIRNNQLEITDSGLHGKNIVDWSEEIDREPYFHLLREKYIEYISDLEDSLNQE